MPSNELFFGTLDVDVRHVCGFERKSKFVIFVVQACRCDSRWGRRILIFDHRDYGSCRMNEVKTGAALASFRVKFDPDTNRDLSYIVLRPARGKSVGRLVSVETEHPEAVHARECLASFSSVSLPQQIFVLAIKESTALVDGEDKEIVEVK